MRDPAPLDEQFNHCAQISFKYVAEALTPLLRLGTFSWIVTRDKFLNSQPWSRPTKQRSAAHQWAAAHRLRTAGLKVALPRGVNEKLAITVQSSYDHAVKLHCCIKIGKSENIIL